MKWLCAVFFLALISSCTKDSRISVLKLPAGCDSIQFSYTNDIRPIFISNCINPDCHGLGGAGSYNYSTYAVIADRIQTGRLENRIDLPLNDPQHMPTGSELSSCDYYKLKTWIKQGFPDN